MTSLRAWVVRLITGREVRDLLRDRRTLFMVFVLPVLLYPILGLLSLQLTAAYEQQARRVVVVGADELPAEPALLNPAHDGFEPGLFPGPNEARLYKVVTVGADSGWLDEKLRAAALQRRDADAVLIVPQGLRDHLNDDKAPLRPQLIFDSGAEQSRDTANAVNMLLEQWNHQIVRGRLERDRKDETYIAPVQTKTSDVARVRGSGTNVWSKLFPFLLVMMSLTGAFYPAVDLCAGEKERGTMETLLISPATRSEIVVAKFLTVLLASIATALVNLASMGLSAAVFFGKVMSGGPRGANAAVAMSLPSPTALFWIILLLIPLAAFFSALSVALAAMARSMKEGQYYLTPLYLVAMPLVFATLMPGIELSLFTSLLPVTGASLLLRSLLQGNYLEARTYFLPVLLPLVVYAALALRWAVEQFRSEAVLFRESDRFDAASWLRHLVRDRELWPTSGEAVFAFVLMLAGAWFSMGVVAAGWQGVPQQQLGFIALPAVLLALVLTSSPRQTLLLNRPRAADLFLALGLAVAVNPLMAELGRVVEELFPLSEEKQKLLGSVLGTMPSLAVTVLVLALVPAICEELAFRGFILQGLRRDFRDGSAIVISACLFGFMHVLVSLVQQLFPTLLLGLVLGLLAVRTRSLWPGVLFHFTNNALSVVNGTLGTRDGGKALPSWLFRDAAHGRYHALWVVIGALAAAVLLGVLWRRPRIRPAGETST